MLILAASAMALGQEAPRYPSHWWTPVPEAGKPDWEILPQAAAPGEVILSKRNELGILSNFAATPFSLHGKRYASVEGFWQRMLYPEGPADPGAKAPGIVWRHTREEVAQMTAFEAKDAGTLAEEHAEDGYRLGDVRRETNRVPITEERRALSLDRRSDAGQA